MKPLVSVIVSTYNRAGTILRTLESILNQTYTNIEIIVVDDGSTDNTLELLAGLKDERIRIIKHPVNRGVTAAKNTGLDNIRGEWFVSVDSDDEIVPEAIETLIRIPLEVDPTVTAIDSGAYETESNSMSEKGLQKDQYVDEATIIRECAGDVFGMTKTSLIGSDRLNEDLPGWEDTLWYKVNARANRYYLHKKLQIYHTEGDDRISKKRFDLKVNSKTYKAVLAEQFFLVQIKKHNESRYIKHCIKGSLYLSATGDKLTARHWVNRLKNTHRLYYMLTAMVTSLPPGLVRKVCKVVNI